MLLIQQGPGSESTLDSDMMLTTPPQCIPQTESLGNEDVENEDLKLYIKFLNVKLSDNDDYTFNLDINRALPEKPFEIYEFKHFTKWCGFFENVAFVSLPESAVTKRSECGTKIYTDKIFIEQFASTFENNWVDSFLACLFSLEINKESSVFVLSPPDNTTVGNGVPPSWFKFQQIDKPIITDVELVKPILPITEIPLSGHFRRRDRDAVLREFENACILAVENDPHALGYFSEAVQTHKVCLTAVKLNGLALKSVKRQTDEIIMNAVKQNGLAMKFVSREHRVCNNYR